MLAQNPRISKVTNPRRMLAHYIVCKHSTWIGDFSSGKKNINVFPHGLVTFQKVTNLSGMLAHTFVWAELSNVFHIIINIIENRCSGRESEWKIIV